MKNADIHICHQYSDTNSTWEFIDAYALDVGPPTRDQTLPGGTIDIYNTSASVVNGVTTCQFTR